MANFSIPGIDPKGIAVLVGSGTVDPEVQRRNSNLISGAWNTRIETVASINARRNWRTQKTAYDAAVYHNAHLPADGSVAPVTVPGDPGDQPDPVYHTAQESNYDRITAHAVNPLFRTNALTENQRAAQATAREAGYLAGGEFDSHFRRIETTRNPPAYSSPVWNTRGTKGWTGPTELHLPGGAGAGNVRWDRIPGNGSAWSRIEGFNPTTMINNRNVGRGVARAIPNGNSQRFRDIIRGDAGRGGNGYRHHPF